MRDVRSMSAEDLDAMNERARRAKLHSDQPDPEQDPLDICRGGSKTEPVETQLELLL
jgi:hypothetical protein